MPITYQYTVDMTYRTGRAMHKTSIDVYADSDKEAVSEAEDILLDEVPGAREIKWVMVKLSQDYDKDER